MITLHPHHGAPLPAPRRPSQAAAFLGETARGLPLATAHLAALLVALVAALIVALIAAPCF